MSVPRVPKPTVGFVDQYCAYARDVLPEVRSFAPFTALHWGLLTESPRTTLPAMARAVGVEDAPSFHHLLTTSPGQGITLRQTRLECIKAVVKARAVIRGMEETGEKQKGQTTDDGARPYSGHLGQMANGRVSVKAYGGLDAMTFPWAFAVGKPQKRLHQDAQDKTNPQLAIARIEALQPQGSRFEVVWADSR